MENIKQIPLRIKENEAELIKKAAEKEYMSMSSWIKKCAIKQSEKILEI